MNEHLSEHNDNTDIPGLLTTRDLLIQIWTKPKFVFNYVLEHNIDKYVPLFFMLAGIVKSLDKASAKNAGDTLPTAGIIFTAIFSGIFFGWMFFYFYAWLISKTGKWINGQAVPRSIRTILGWAAVPAIPTLLLIFLQIIFFPNDIFKSEFEIITLDLLLYRLLLIVPIILLSIWSFILSIVGISVAQGFGYGKAFLNMLLAALSIVIPIIIVAFFIEIFN